MRTLGRRLADLLLTAAASVGVLCLVTLLAGLIFDVRPLIFRSGSMAPAIEAGSLALAHEISVDQVQVGDIVSVPLDQARVTHRVTQILHSDGDVQLRLRGDANTTVDPEPYRVDHVDRVWFSIPWLGTAISWLSRPPGVFVLAGYVALLLTVIMRRSGGRRSPPPDHDQPIPPTAFDGGVDHGRRRPLERSGQRPKTVQAGVGIALLATAVAVPATPTMASFSDNVPVSGSTITAATVPAPTFNCGLLGVLSVTFNWTAVPGATGYTVHYGNNGSSTVSTTKTTHTITAAISGGTAWVVANRNFGSTTWTSKPSNTRSYTVAVVSLCA